MIFITNERPLFSAFVNGIVEVKTKNGGIIKKVILGTSEKKQDDTRNSTKSFTIWYGGWTISCWFSRPNYYYW